jgi:hypothetical protein
VTNRLLVPTNIINYRSRTVVVVGHATCNMVMTGQAL